MKYKKIFLDENRPFHKESSEAIEILLQQQNVDIFTSCDIITTLYYLLSKKGKTQALDFILDVNELCFVVEFSNSEIKQSCNLMKQNKNFKDLEDTIQYIMAKKVECDLILSNDKGFVSQDLILMSSMEFIQD